jgi:hypothetical protein
MKLLTDLVFKCYKYDLDFSYSPGASGNLHIYTFSEEGEIIEISQGYIKPNWREETVGEALEYMHFEVDSYLNRVSYQVDEGSDTEHAQAALTEQERKMKEAGHKESDFR